jgi:bifunctional DNase/RNase
MPEEYEDPEGREDLEEPPAFFPKEDGLGSDEPKDTTLLEVRIEGVFEDVSNGPTARFVIVKDEIGRRVPIAIGGFESRSILEAMEGLRPDRPMTHDLVRNIMEKLGATLERVAIDDLWNTVYYAKLVLSSELMDDEILIDARPSDAIALALRFNAPIYMSDAILEQGIEEE